MSIEHPYDKMSDGQEMQERSESTTTQQTSGKCKSDARPLDVGLRVSDRFGRRVSAEQKNIGLSSSSVYYNVFSNRSASPSR
jgi:hypothetical protein